MQDTLYTSSLIFPTFIITKDFIFLRVDFDYVSIPITTSFSGKDLRHFQSIEFRCGSISGKIILR